MSATGVTIHDRCQIREWQHQVAEQGSAMPSAEDTAATSAERERETQGQMRLAAMIVTSAPLGCAVLFIGAYALLRWGPALIDALGWAGH